MNYPSVMIPLAAKNKNVIADLFVVYKQDKCIYLSQ